MHLQRGGLPTITQRNNPVTLALWHMECEGYVEKNPNQGSWGV